jgi:hypothetical protein
LVLVPVAKLGSTQVLEFPAVKRILGDSTPPEAYYEAVNAGSRWFSVGTLCAIVTLLLTIATQVTSLVWILVATFAVAALFCYLRLLQYGRLSGRIRREWRKSVRSTSIAASDWSMRELILSHPMITGTLFFMIGAVFMVIVAFAKS